jgi:hypothetical protein
MCDAKNTLDGKCMDARKDECKWHVAGECTKKEDADEIDSEATQD